VTLALSLVVGVVAPWLGAMASAAYSGGEIFALEQGTKIAVGEKGGP
jgi:hypothetical protein